MNETVQDKNLKFKGVFLNSPDNNEYETNKIDNINSFLEKETKQNKNETWNKLDKTGKIRLLNKYIETYALENSLTAEEISELKIYLTDSLDKKKLQHVKDVFCDKNTGKILSIPTLHFNATTRKFTLKRAEKRVSTLKSLGKGKKPLLTTASISCEASSAAPSSWVHNCNKIDINVLD